jgi:hypothetical protein
MAAYIPSGGHFSDFLLIRRVGRPVPAVAEVKPRVRFFSGVAYVEGRLIKSAEDLQEFLTGDEAFGTLSDATGSFTAVIAVGGRTLLLNDLFGMDQLFCLQSDRVIMASNRLMAVVVAMRKLGIARRPNVPVIAASLASQHSFFQTAFGENTFVEGLNAVPCDSILDLSEKGVQLRRKRVFEKLNSLDRQISSSYRDYVREASRAVLDKVKLIAEDNSFTSRVLDVSGGKDSRVVFAAALASGTLQRFDLNTQKTRDPLDFKVGLGLSQAYGGRLYAGDARPTFWKRSAFGVSVWRSMKCGLHHRMGVPNWTSLGKNTGSVRLSGASGEVYRDFWVGLFRRELKTDLSGQDGLGDLFQALTKTSPVPKQYLAAAQDRFAESIANLPGENHFEKLSNHYLFYRNRCHFGIAPYNSFSRQLEWAPLQSPAALMASRSLDTSGRASGVMLFDMIDHLFPSLNAAPFA